MNNHLIKNSLILAIEKLIPRELYSLSIVLKNELPTCQKYFCNIFCTLQVEWKEIYLLSRKVSIENNIRMFQYEKTNNILYLNKQLFIFNKIDTKLCSYCRLQDETINHFFVECKFAIRLWSDLRHFCHCSFDAPVLYPECHLWIFCNWSWFSNTFKPHTAFIQILYLFVKRLLKTFIWSSIESFCSGKKNFIRKWKKN